MKKILFLSILLMFIWSTPSMAHFQMLYTPESYLDRGQALDLKLVFTHPFDAGHTMDMAPVEKFYVVQQRGEDAEPVQVDLREYLKEITWTSMGNTGKAYEANIPSKVLRSMGDYVFTLVPGPYYEKADDEYIQQFTKMIVNVGGVPGNWAKPLGLPAEIVPLDKPYANWEGGIFRGVVMANGQPVPHAELEVEYLNHKPDMQNNAFEKCPEITVDNPNLEVLGIRADAHGQFSIGLSRAGWWGVAALGVGPEDEYKGKGLAQEAVLWIEVTKMP